MSSFSIYILSIAGATLLTVLVDLVLPSGSTSKYLKGVMALVVIFVIVTPIPKLLKTGLSFETTSQESINQNLLDTIKEQQILQTQQNLEKALENEGFRDIKLQIEGDFENGVLKINSIFVDLSNFVLAQKNQHIFNTEAVKDFLLKQTGLKAGQVIFYET